MSRSNKPRPYLPENTGMARRRRRRLQTAILRFGPMKKGPISIGSCLVWFACFVAYFLASVFRGLGGGHHGGSGPRWSVTQHTQQLGLLLTPCPEAFISIL